MVVSGRTVVANDLGAVFTAGPIDQEAADVGSQGGRECHEIPSGALELRKLP